MLTTFDLKTTEKIAVLRQSCARDPTVFYLESWKVVIALRRRVLAIPRASSKAERPMMLDILPDVCHTLERGRPTRDCDAAFEKNLNAFKPSEHPTSVRGKIVQIFRWELWL